MKKSASLLISFGLIAGVIFAFSHSREIMDFVILARYNPSAEVSKLAEDTTLTDSSRSVFYVNKPQIEDKTTFSSACPDGEQTIVLGCFIDGGGIFLLNVTDQRLEGIVQVTSAHELLHAEYDRLSPKERIKVDKMTSDFFATLNNERIKTNIENYRKKDPSVVPNELHSILGTEVRNLPSDLENYYGKYFKNRLKVVEYSENYEKTFSDLENQEKTLQAQLDSIKADIDSKDVSLKKLSSELETRKNTMNKLMSNKNYEQYNSMVDGYNNLVNQYNTLVRSKQKQVETYNQLVDEYNQLSVAEGNLIKALKSEPAETVGGVSQ